MEKKQVASMQGKEINFTEEFIPETPLEYSPINITPKKDMVVIQPIPTKENITKNGIILPEGSKVFGDNSIKGVVVRIGRDLVEDYKVGQVVVLTNPHAIRPVIINDILYSFIYNSDIVGTYDDMLINEKKL